MERKKGRSLIQFADDCCIVDVETTGLDPAYSEIIEIGALRVRGGEPRDRFTMLVKPADPVDDFITKLTGITNEMLADALPLKAVLPVFRTFLGDDLIVGHNVNFDINFLYDGCEALNLDLVTNDFVDTMRLSRIVHSELNHHRLKDMCKLYNIENQREHRAISDCEATLKLIQHLKEDAAAKRIDLSQYPRAKRKLSASDLSAQTDTFDESHPLFDKECVFTGKMRIERRQAMQLVLNLGGRCADNVTKRTDFLIIGNTEYCSNMKGEKTGKMKKAEEQILKGFDLTILSESAFFDLL